ncbi:YidC/Oxa1 family membrane protein insertase [Chloroflexota bacterium]
MNTWELIVQQPVINVLIVMTDYLAGSFGMAIIALTVIVNLVMFPLTLKQIRATKAMQMMQPKLAELQKKYGKDKQRMAQEQMRLYKESGMNPAGCMVPMLIQMPIWIALYQSIMMSLAVAPESLLNLSRYLYDWPVVYSLLPLSNSFLWLTLAEPDTFLAILVGASMWLQQKMSTPTSTDAKQQAQSRMMLWMMPMMFTFLALSFPSGLALFWVTSSVVRIVMQYKVTGWGGLARTRDSGPVASDKRYMKYITRAEEKSLVDVEADIVETSSAPEERDRGLGSIGKPSRMRYQPGKDRAQHRKKK